MAGGNVFLLYTSGLALAAPPLQVAEARGSTLLLWPDLSNFGFVQELGGLVPEKVPFTTRPTVAKDLVSSVHLLPR